MRIEYITPFVKSAYIILGEFLGVGKVQRGKVHLRQSTQDVMGMVAVIGLTGHAEGRMLLDMHEETALSIAGVINEETFTEIDGLVEATIQELANMVAGTAVTELQDQGFLFDITPPAVLQGKQMRLMSQSQEILIVPMKTEYGLIDVYISIFDKM